MLYYGDEIGMGDNIYLGDRNGVRTPMQWSDGPQRRLLARPIPQQLYLPVIIDPEYHYETINVEAQQNNPHSLLWWTRRVIALRKRYRAFGRGGLEFLHPDNRKVLAFIRRWQDEQLLVVANLSRFVQYVELDLSRWRDMAPVELFGRTRFPPIGELPYFLTLGPHAFYWFHLERVGVPEGRREARPLIEVGEGWETVFEGAARGRLEEVLAEYLQQVPWNALQGPADPLGPARRDGAGPPRRRLGLADPGPG